MKKLLCCFFVIGFLFFNQLSAQLAETTFVTGAQFLSNSPDARSSALGGQGVATTPDVYSQNFNAAKFAFMNAKRGAQISYSPYFTDIADDVFETQLSFFTKSGDRSAFGFSFLYSTFGEVVNTQLLGGSGNPIETNSFNSNEFSFDVSYSLKLSQKLSSGVTGRYVYSDLAPDEPTIDAASAFAVDLSLYYISDTTGNKNIIGLQIANIGTKLDDNSGSDKFLPASISLGYTREFVMGSGGNNYLALSGTVSKGLVPEVETDGAVPDESTLSGIVSSFGNSEQDISAALGVEYRLKDRFFLRGGYRFENSDNSLFDSTVGGGLGVNFPVSGGRDKLGIDLSYNLGLSDVSVPTDNILKVSLNYLF